MESMNEARDLAWGVREASTTRDMVPKTEEDARITVALHRFVRQWLVIYVCLSGLQRRHELTSWLNVG